MSNTTLSSPAAKQISTEFKLPLYFIETSDSDSSTDLCGQVERIVVFAHINDITIGTPH